MSQIASNGHIAVAIPGIDIRTAEIVLVGDSPLIMNHWSEKAKQQIRNTQQQKATQAKEAKNPQECYEASMHRFPDGRYAFPSNGVKACAVSGSRFLDTKMTEMRGAFHVLGEFCEIIGEPRMREDMVRVGMGKADIRYRAVFTEWKAIVLVRYNARAISLEQIINQFNAGGFGVGLGEWRPEKDGSYGMFHVAMEDEI